MRVGDILERLTSGQRVYGEPYERDGATVIPAYSVRAGGGFGQGNAGKDGDESAGPGGSGGGGGVIARPVGAYVMRDGDVRWEPAIDVNRAILGAQIVAALALIVYAVTRPARRR